MNYQQCRGHECAALTRTTHEKNIMIRIRDVDTFISASVESRESKVFFFTGSPLNSHYATARPLLYPLLGEDRCSTCAGEICSCFHSAFLNLFFFSADFLCFFSFFSSVLIWLSPTLSYLLCHFYLCMCKSVCTV